MSQEEAMISRAHVFAAIVSLTLLGSASAYGHSGRIKSFPSPGQDLEKVGQVLLTQPANASGDLCLSVTDAVVHSRMFPDVIMDVFSYPKQEFLGEGTYSCNDLGCINARVILPKVTKDRQVTVIIRPKPGTSVQYQVPLSSTLENGFSKCPDSWWHLGNFDIQPGQRKSLSDGLPKETHVMTVQEQRGANDTILMALNNGVPFAFDDNGGPAQMSFLCLPTACPAGTCELLPARRSNQMNGTPPAKDPQRYAAPRPGPVTLIWDDGAHNQRADMDQDGLGDELERLIGTCDPNHPEHDMDEDGTADCWDKDVDGDGVPDSYEVLGKADASGDQNTSINPLRFPYYGANPTRQDLFVEMAWAPQCTVSTNPNCIPGGASDKDNSNLWKWKPETAEKYAGKFAPYVTVHVDIGNPFPAGASETETTGDWGVTRLPDGFDYKSLPDGEACWHDWDCASSWFCGGLFGGFTPLSPRYGTFHHAVVGDERPMIYGLCPRVDSRPGAAAHETGHWLGLHHSGHRACDSYLFGLIPGECYGMEGDINCKPNYLSIMNYAYQDDPHFGQGAAFPGFSPGRFLAQSTGSGDVVLDPTKMDEGSGLWPNGNFDPVKDAQVLDLLETALGRRTDHATGAVDWDMDGHIQPKGTLTRAFINRKGPKRINSEDCDCSPPARDGATLIPSAIARRQDYGGGWNGSATLSSIETGFRLYYAYNCGVGTAPPCVQGIHGTYFDCKQSGDDPCRNGSPWSEYVRLRENAYMLTAVGGIVVFADSKNRLQYAGRSPSGKSVGGGLGGPTVAGPPTALADPESGGDGHNIRVYAAVSATSGGATTTTLRVWRYDSASDTWPVAGEIQKWTSGVPIEMPSGTSIGLTHGYRSDVVDAGGVPVERIFAAIPTVSLGAPDPQLHLAMLVTSAVDPVKVCTAVPVLDSLCVTVAKLLVDAGWAPLPDAIWSGRGGGKPKANVGRIGLAFRPEDPAVAVGPHSGRFYITWQQKLSNGRSRPYETFTRGNVLPLSAVAPEDTEHGLVVVGDGMFYNFEADWPAGVSIIYAGGHVRGAGVDEFRSSRYFPHVDGIFPSQQRDHDDITHIKKRLSCALTQCGSLNKD
jgi:hypothetical protein